MSVSVSDIHIIYMHIIYMHINIHTHVILILILILTLILISLFSFLKHKSTNTSPPPVFKSSATDAYSIDFGPGIGKREVARLNLIECESCHVTGVQTVQTFFGTAPPFWNTLFVLMAKLIPQRVLQNRNAMDALAKVRLGLV